MAIYQLRNYTAYSSVDVLALFDVVEDWLRRNGRAPHAMPHCALDATHTVVMKYYHPRKNAPQHYWSYKVGKRITVPGGVVRLKGVRCGVAAGSIEIVEPNKLRLPVLEALASAGKELPTLPASVVELLLLRITEFYDAVRYGDGPAILSLERPVVHIDASVAEVLGAEEKQRVARVRYQGLIQDAQRHSKVARNAVLRAVAALRDADRVMGRAHLALPSSTIRVELDRCANELSASITVLDASLEHNSIEECDG